MPIHEPAPVAIKELAARNAKAPPRFEIKPPEGAANVVVVLIDDIGFSATSSFGGPVNMPTVEKMAADGSWSIGPGDAVNFSRPSQPWPAASCEYKISVQRPT